MADKDLWPEAKASQRPTVAFALSLAGVVVGGALYAWSWFQDPHGQRTFASLGLRIVAGGLGLACFVGAAFVAPAGRPRVRAGYWALVIVAFYGLVDALLLFAGAAGWARNLGFLLSAFLLGSVLLRLLIKSKGTGDATLTDFFARHWMVVGFLLFLIVARIAADGPLRRFLPTILLNAAFLLPFFSTLSYLAARYLKTFGSPVSWDAAKRHEQEVRILHDPEMERLGGLLETYVERGDQFPRYRDVVHDLAERTKVPTGIVDAMLERHPLPLEPSLVSTPRGARVGTSTLMAAAAALVVASFLFSSGATQAAMLLLVGMTAGLAPLIDEALRPASDPPSAVLWGVGGVLVSLCLAPGLLRMGTAALLLALPLLIYGANALRFVLRRSKVLPASAARRVRSIRQQAQRSRRLLWTGAGVAAACLGYFLLVPLKPSLLALPRPDPIILGAGIVSGACLLLAGYLLGPLLVDHRRRLERLHEQETAQRADFHLRIIQTLEGAS
jgi:hypothetical protein